MKHGKKREFFGGLLLAAVCGAVLLSGPRTALLEELELDPALCAAAQVRAEECVGSFSHTRPDGSSYRTALSEQGVEKSYVGENVATGYPDARRVGEGWMKSEGHRANILNASCCRIGIGLEENAGNRYRGYAWCQLFTD